jgi:hypothetical protein
VLREYRATHREVAERYFTCARCGARGEVSFNAVGRSGWAREGILENEDAIGRAHEEAEVELRKDAQRTLDMVKCPTCGLRAPGAVFWACARIFAWAVIGLVYGVVRGGAEIALLVAAIPTAVFAWLELSRLRRAKRALITKLEPGKLPERAPPKPQPARLPAARVVAAPERAPSAPIEPARAPEPAPEPGVEPTFLRER